jgi:hypothetical protein
MVVEFGLVMMTALVVWNRSYVSRRSVRADQASFR